MRSLVVLRAFGMALVAIANFRGATLYAMVSTQDLKGFIVSELGRPGENVLQHRENSFMEGVFAATNGNGVDWC